MKFIIDRFEEDIAVIETKDKEMINIPRKILPIGAKEGDIIGTTILEDENGKERVERIEDKFRILLEDGENKF